jgi:DnaK suppressor protein
MTPLGHAPRTMGRRELAIHLSSLRADLEEQRRFRVHQIKQLGVASIEPGSAVDEPHEQVNVALRAAAIAVLADINAALVRIDRGCYGRCERCDIDIPLERLQVLPMVKLCMRCQRLHQGEWGPIWIGTRTARTERSHRPRRKTGQS